MGTFLQRDETVFQIQGIDEIVAKVRRLNDNLNRTTQIRILKEAAKPIVSAARKEAPEADDYVKIQGNLIKPGILKRSIGVIVGKSKDWPNVQIGARAKSGFGGFRGGWFAHFVHEGHKIRGKRSFKKKPNVRVFYNKGTNRGTTSKDQFMDRAFDSTKFRVEKELTKKIIKIATKGF